MQHKKQRKSNSHTQQTDKEGAPGLHQSGGDVVLHHAAQSGVDDERVMVDNGSGTAVAHAQCTRGKIGSGGPGEFSGTRDLEQVMVDGAGPVAKRGEGKRGKKSVEAFDWLEVLLVLGVFSAG